MIRLENIHLQFGERLLLKEQNLTLSQGQLIIINGPSGCGKTTLLNEIALIGNGSCTYWWDDEKIDHSDEKKKALLRRCQIGYLVQDLEIIDPYLNLEDNLRCMCALADISYDEKRVRSLMQELDLNIDLSRKIDTVSGGERQRFALLTILLKDARLIICDEPTSALDLPHARQLFEILTSIAHAYGICVVVASHDPLSLSYGDVIYHMKDQHLLTEKQTASPPAKKCPLVDREIPSAFYKFYSKRHRYHWGHTLFLTIAMMMLACIEPLIKNFDTNTLAKTTPYLIIANTSQSIPDARYISSAPLFSQSQITMIETICETDALPYWELTIAGEKRIIRPSLDLTQSEGKNTLLLLKQNDQTYPIEMAVNDQGHEIIQVPYEDLRNAINEAGITQSSSYMIQGSSELTQLRDTLHRWMPNASVTIDQENSLQVQQLLAAMQKQLPFLQLIIWLAAVGGNVLWQYMEIKSNRDRNRILYLYGIKDKERQKLAWLEHRFMYIVSLCAASILSILLLLYTHTFGPYTIFAIFTLMFLYLLVTECSNRLISYLTSHIKHK